MDHAQSQTRNSWLGHSDFQSFAPAHILLFGLLVVLAFGIVFFSPAARLEEPQRPDADLEREPLLPDQTNPT
jgi:hypothetical protein